MPNCQSYHIAAKFKEGVLAQCVVWLSSIFDSQIAFYFCIAHDRKFLSIRILADL